MSMTASAGKPMRALVSPEEWRVRVDFAAAYRIAAYLGWDDLLYAHMTARVEGEPNKYLMSPYELAFEEVTATSIHKLDDNGRNLAGNKGTPHPFALPFHKAIYRGFPEARCVIHVHSIAAAAVATQKQGLLPYTQFALITGGVGYHDYEGVIFTDAEGERMVRSFNGHQCLLQRGHGLIVWGKSVRDAFMLAYNLHRACLVQIAAQTGGAELVPLSDEVITATQEHAFGVTPKYEHIVALSWDAILRKLDRVLPGYDQ